MGLIQQRAEYLHRQTRSPGPTLPEPRRQQERRAPVIARHVTRTEFFVAPVKDFILTVSKEWFTCILESYRLPEHFRNIVPLCDGGAAPRVG